MNRREFVALLTGGALGNLGGVALASSEGGPPRFRRRRAPVEHLEGEGAGMRRIVWSVDTDRPLWALTFDDGPDPHFTPRILEILDHYRVGATFMAMGYNAVRHTPLLRATAAAGHEIGSHTWSHDMLPAVSPERVRSQIERGTRAVASRVGGRVRFFRPPYGRFSEAAVRTAADLGHDIVLWSVTRGGLGLRQPEEVASHVVGSLRPGDIVDLHDGIGRATFNPEGEAADRLRSRRMTEIEALPRILDHVRAKGLRPVTLSELLASWRPIDAPPSLPDLLGRAQEA